ncbi:MAG: carboxypeptidase regulatory-like domain-containing protein [Flavobacteriales bacterium]|jgi:hypothetical protein
MIKTLLTFALALLITTTLSAQSSGAIYGKVQDGHGQPVIGAIVTVTAGADIKGDAADEEGKFKIKPLNAGTYTLTVQATGMNTISLNQVVVDPGIITFVNDLVMSEQVYENGPIVIEFDRNPPLISPDITPVMLRSKDLKNMPSANGGSIANIAASLSSDIKPAANGEDLYVRGSRAGSTLFFIDGVKLRDSSVQVPSSGISSVGVYTGALPAKYGDTTGGVVVVETKSYLEDYYQKINQ